MKPFTNRKDTLQFITALRTLKYDELSCIFTPTWSLCCHTRKVPLQFIVIYGLQVLKS